MHMRVDHRRVHVNLADAQASALPSRDTTEGENTMADQPSKPEYLTVYPEDVINAPMGTKPPLRDAQSNVDQALERLAALTANLIERVEPVLLPASLAALARDMAAEPEQASEIGHVLRQWRNQIGAISDSVEDALSRVDL